MNRDGSRLAPTTFFKYLRKSLSGSSLTTVVGKCHIFDTSAGMSSAVAFSVLFFGGGSKIHLLRSSTNTAAASSTPTVARFLRFSGINSWIPNLRALQNVATGHNKHCGERGVQIVAPSSIMA